MAGGLNVITTRYPLTDRLIFHLSVRTSGREASSRLIGLSLQWPIGQRDYAERRQIVLFVMKRNRQTFLPLIT